MEENLAGSRMKESIAHIFNGGNVLREDQGGSTWHRGARSG
jgi:hypothetical protein